MCEVAVGTAPHFAEVYFLNFFLHFACRGFLLVKKEKPAFSFLARLQDARRCGVLLFLLRTCAASHDKCFFIISLTWHLGPRMCYAIAPTLFVFPPFFNMVTRVGKEEKNTNEQLWCNR